MTKTFDVSARSVKGFVPQAGVEKNYIELSWKETSDSGKRTTLHSITIEGERADGVRAALNGGEDYSEFSQRLAKMFKKEGATPSPSSRGLAESKCCKAELINWAAHQTSRGISYSECTKCGKEE